MMNSSRVYPFCRSAYVIVARRLWKWFLGGLGLSYSGIIRPRGAGFYCNDTSLDHTYNGDTVSVASLFIVCLLGPILFIFPIECIKKWTKERNGTLGPFLYRIWRSCWKVWRAQLTGILVVLVMTEFSKTLISEPRPHFLDTCKPNVTDMCKTGNEYIVNFSCTSSNFTKSQILDSQKSFPSGHTSMSVYTAVFMMWYLGRAVHWPYSFLMKPFLQLLWACYALFCSLTRITDRRHHWWDVLAGATLGFGVGFILIQAVSRTIRSERDSPPDEDDPADDGSLSKDDLAMRIQSSTGNSPSKRLSVRRLLSNSSVSTTIAEDREISDVPNA